MTITNLTPHNITMFKNGKVDRVFTSEGLARVSSKISHHSYIGGIRINSIERLGLMGLPDETTDQYYIVSQIVKMYCSCRKDLLVPDELVRNDQGLVIGCRALSL